MFSPVNVAGPDQRRKQLMAKLGQQQQGNLAGRSSAAQSVGQAFHPGIVHALVKAASTQGTNVLPSVLARLGIYGHNNPDEVSQGFGAPISSYTPGVGVQDPNQNAPGIPAAGSPDPSQAAQALGGLGIAQQRYGNSVLEQANAIQASGAGGGPAGGIPGTDAASAYANSVSQQQQAISLGGGHFFDPTTGQITFNPAAVPGRLSAQ
jgi:hypothetical protein